MGWRFRKSVKLLPGVRLNISKTGTSWTLGGRGASINVGRGKKYLNAGLPGTGLSVRERLDGGADAPPRAGIIDLLSALFQIAAVIAGVVLLFLALG